MSAHLAVPTKTEKHPDHQQGHRPDPKERPKPAHPAPQQTTATASEKAPGLKQKNTKTADGKAIIVAEGDLPDLTFLKKYTGAPLDDKAWKDVADDLKCEVNAIWAIAKVESSGAGFDSVTKRPIILFERHVFHKKSNGRYSDQYPDISSPNPYLRIRDKHGKIIQERKTRYDEASAQGKLAESDFYPAVQHPNYKRLAKAMQLDRRAALMSCSWGMFQVMGFNHAASGYSDVELFVDAMATSEVEHIRALRNFIKADRRLLKAIQEKDWLSFARGYNGAKQEGYDLRMEKMYTYLTKNK